jgi:general secretion pathway protein G
MKSKHTQSGFTLIEIMIVVVILSILASMVIPRLLDRPDQARLVKAQQDIRMIESTLSLYRLDNYNYPSSEHGLDALIIKPIRQPLPPNWTTPYLDRLPFDPWGQPYIYIMPGQHGDFDLTSYGSDRKSGGEGHAADVNNWQLR